MPFPSSLSALCVAFTLVVLQVGRAMADNAEDSAKLLIEISNHFAEWDLNHDGILSPAELDTLVSNPAITGNQAAAVATLKRASRSLKFKSLAFNKYNLRQLAADPSAYQRDLASMYHYASEQLTKRQSELFDAGGPRLEAIRQGRLGNCYALAPLAAMTTVRPEEVRAMFQPQPNGIYDVRLGKKTFHVTAPTDAEIAMTSSNEGNGLWVNIYEKAVGQARIEGKPGEEKTGSAIDALAKGGSSGSALAYITGHEILRFSCKFAKEGHLSPDEYVRRIQVLRSLMVSAQKEKRLMTCGTLKPSTPGLTPNHAYAILGFDAGTDKVRLWNPHGENFAPQSRPGRGFGYPMTAGIFEVPLPEFVTLFSGLTFELLPKGN